MADSKGCFFSYVSIIQELIFNSIDAKATCIAVRLQTDPSLSVQVIDNGEGIEELVMRHIGLMRKVIEVPENQILPWYGINGSSLLALVKAHNGSLEIVSRCKETELTLRKQISYLRNTCSLRWDSQVRPSAGTTVTLEDVQLKGTEGLCRKKWEADDLEELLLVVHALSLRHPNISFSVHDIATGETLAAHRRTSSTQQAFRDLLPNYTGQLVKIHSTEGPLRLDGFIANRLIGQRNFQFVFLNRKLVQNTRIHRFINRQLSKYRHVLKESAAEKEAAFFVELFCLPVDFSVEFYRHKTKILFRDDEAVAKLLQKSIWAFLETVVRQQRKESSTKLRKRPIKQRQSFDKVLAHWLTPRQVVDRSIDEEEMEIDLKSVKDSPKIESVDYNSLSGSLTFTLNDAANVTARTGGNVPTEVKRTLPREASFQPKRKIRVLPNNQIVIVDVKSPEEEEGDGSEQRLWIPGNKDLLHEEDAGGDEEEEKTTVQSIYFSKSKSGFPLHLIPANGKAELLEVFKNVNNPFMEPPVTIGPRPEIRIRPPKSCTFSKGSFSATRVLSQVDNRFIVCLMPDVEGQLHVVLVDQHAAHERVRLEQLTKHYTTQDADGTIVSVQTSDVDPVFEVSTPAMKEELTGAVSLFLKKCGVNLRTSGPRRAQIFAVPKCFLARGASEVKHGRASAHEALVEELIQEKCDEYESSRGGSTRPMSAVVRNILNSLACHGAVKFGDPLSVDECAQLMEALSRCDNPFQCAHGRPVITVLVDLKQLDRLEPPPAPRPRIGDLVRRFQNS